ncbi:dienelactone hydrolase family protein [Synechocystis sp. LKSZ1]|uniref:dienelactone hydrolase family protein n=1 Tax=Synechocystis sp. LKSZ1 TaxID=3144951 RepID=UPI00336C16F0
MAVRWDYPRLGNRFSPRLIAPKILTGQFLERRHLLQGLTHTAVNVLDTAMVKSFLFACTVAALTCWAPLAQAEMLAKPWVYQIDNQPFEGYVGQNTGFGKNQPIVILIHDWNGLDQYEKMRTNMLSTQGYTVFAIDLYGQGVRPKNTEESKIESGKLYGNLPLMRQRLLAAIAEAKKLPGVDPNRIAAIGYCFGGSAVLELARSGADLDGLVSFHGGLAIPPGQDYKALSSPLLILHGAADPVAPMTQVTELAEALNAVKANFDMDIYGGVRHSFSVWTSDDYDPHADLQSWSALLAFLERHLRSR